MKKTDSPPRLYIYPLLQIRTIKHEEHDDLILLLSWQFTTYLLRRAKCKTDQRLKVIASPT